MTDSFLYSRLRYLKLSPILHNNTAHSVVLDCDGYNPNFLLSIDAEIDHNW